MRREAFSHSNSLVLPTIADVGKAWVKPMTSDRPAASGWCPNFEKSTPLPRAAEVLKRQC